MRLEEVKQKVDQKMDQALQSALANQTEEVVEVYKQLSEDMGEKETVTKVEQR